MLAAPTRSGSSEGDKDAYCGIVEITLGSRPARNGFLGLRL